MPKKTLLNNGLKLISASLPKRNSVALGIWIKVGGRYENKINKGISHFLEHMLFKGSEKFSCSQIKQSIEGIGGSLNGFTSEELTCYLAKVPLRYLGRGLEVLSDMVLRPKLDAQEIAKEKTVIIEELKMYRDLPQSYMYELLDELMWPNHPLGEPIIGTEESINAVSRDSLNEYRQNFYVPSNIIISAVGTLDHEKLNHAVNKIFGKIKSSGLKNYVPASRGQSAPGLKVFNKDTEQTHLALGFHALHRDHPKRYALGLLHVILGGNMSSRLFDELREKRGLAYEIGTQAKRFYDAGAFIVHAGIETGKVSDALRCILQELSKAKETLVSENEFSRAKEFYLGQLSLALEDTMDYMLGLGETLSAQGKIFSFPEVVKEVSRIKRKDLQEVANAVFRNETMNLALIGPLKNQESELTKVLTL